MRVNSIVWWSCTLYGRPDSRIIGCRLLSCVCSGIKRWKCAKELLMADNVVGKKKPRDSPSAIQQPKQKKRLELVHQTLLAPNPIPPSKSRGFKIHNSKSELRCIKVAASHRVNIHRRHCLRRIKKTKKCKGFAAKSETKNRQGGRPRHRIILSKRISRKRKKKNAAASLGAPFF